MGKTVSKAVTRIHRIHNEFNELFPGIGCLEDKFSLQVREGSCPYKAPPKRVVYVLQNPLKEELEQNIVLLCDGKTSECYNNFVLVPKVNGKVRLCLDAAQINKALTRPIHRGPTLNDILSRLKALNYLMLIDTSSRYLNLKLNEKSSYLMTFSCPFGRYGVLRLLFGSAPTGDMFQKKIDELFNDIPNGFGIGDDILIAGFDTDGRNHDIRLEQVLWRCR